MTGQIYYILYNVIVLLIIFFLQLFMPKLTRKEIFFGVRIPEKELDNIKLKNIESSYIKICLILGIPYIILLTYLMYTYIENPLIFILGMILYLLINFVIYFSIHNKVKNIKSYYGWDKGKQQVVIIDTNFTMNKNKNVLVSQLWFLIPLTLIILNIIIGYNVYPNLPEKLPIHWNFAGEIDRYTIKSPKIIYQFPLIQFFMLIVLYFSYKSIGWSKQQISSSNPEESLEKNRIFRRLWSGYMVFISIMMQLIFTLANMTTLLVIKISASIIMLSILIPTTLILIVSIILSIKTGQGGSRIKLKNGTGFNTIITERNDDKYWKLGSFYVNKDDPAIFVEKRFGIGWTINFGRIEGILIFVALIASIILIPLILK
ncbi:putative membrane protein [Clostridium tetanomorphum]|uniref:DUF1648 domain-containing protein n=1 Tax=Clostridium tetanomorphum TaxID=1553 RepID=A0A923EA90_CLOTT|nr:DUF5808 domain-containing protein [Clostridium tetanomorphum]KAJ49554.1 hypothetical protein CTM_22486 [Clostridium tetanomorphum DSM 665]KAJ53909.1 hypothetical protein CTM_00055 [Clostridium tetanomorphum DSM 665]MBC2398107.1 DUF1648 domain-containing protein [Clostridium tetanomorphum]MBP1864676.1 putative membrane protein [Clostridium tetanomorphum]NRS84146.1 putative membrane protein [Clostridium tetanomorphum]